jgi:hypothetical protein
VADPGARLRATALALYDAVDAHPWIGPQLSREPFRSTNARVFEAVGEPLAALGVPDDQQFDVASALTSYIVGACAQNAAPALQAAPGLDRTTYLHQAAERWGALEAATHPFVHRMLSRLADHDDRQQFAAGLDLMLAGVAAAHEPGAPCSPVAAAGAAGGERR